MAVLLLQFQLFSLRLWNPDLFTGCATCPRPAVFNSRDSRSGLFTSIFFIAVYIPPQTDAGTKTALNELYVAISKQENAHPEAALLVAGTLM